MAELLAAGMTGGVVSRDVKPLKAPEGPPHDLGQYYVIIDPQAGEAFYERMSKIVEAVALDQGTRIPGRDKKPSEAVEVPEVLWSTVQQLA